MLYPNTTIGEHTGTLAYLDAKMRLTTPAKASWAKLVCDDGWQGFFTVAPTERAAEYDESKHPRDEKGQWAVSEAWEPAFTTLYHGTTSEALASIKEQGLIPAAGKGGDTWRKTFVTVESGSVEALATQALIDSRKASVFLTPSAVDALAIAQKVAELHPGSAPVVLGVAADIASDLMKPDEEWTGNLRHLGRISPYFIKGVLDTTSTKTQPVFKPLDGRVRYYLVLVCGTQARAAKSNNQSALHAVADANEAKLEVAIRYAFAKGRAAVRKSTLKSATSEKAIFSAVDGAPSAVKKALLEVLPKTLLQVMEAGGKAASLELRTAGSSKSGNYGHAGRPGEVGGSAPAGPHRGFIAPDGTPHVVESDDHNDLAKVLLKDESAGIREALDQGYVRYWVKNGEIDIHFRAGNPSASRNAMQLLKDYHTPGDRIYMDIEPTRNLIPGRAMVLNFPHFFDNIREANNVIREAGLMREQDQRARLVAAGGKGSGNFGHGGRPGEVGGSGESTFFHGTVTDTLASIRAHGLDPNHAGIIWPTESKPGHVYMSETREDAERWAAGASAKSSIPPEGSARHVGQPAVPMVLEVAVPKEVAKEFTEDTHGIPHAVQFKGAIKPEWIRRAWSLKKKFYIKDMEAWDYESGTEDERNAKWRQLAEAVIFYVPFAVKVPESRTAGGAGSGNFGHSGRPGEVGGSSSIAIFHGTSSKALASIKKEGLKPAGGVGADTWAVQKAGWGSPDDLLKSHGVSNTVIADRHASVFLTENLYVARQYARVASEITHGTPIVLKVNVPESEFTTKATPDEASAPGDQSFRFRGGIRPEWIVGRLNAWNDLRPLEAVRTIYAVIMVEEDDLRTAAGPATPRFTFDVRDEHAITWAHEHAAELAKNLSETSEQNIRAAVERVLEDADYELLIDDILDAVGDEDRAKLIARTETMMAVNEGQRQAWRQATDEGLLSGDEKKVWIATPEVACDECADLDGTEAALDGMYTSPLGYDGGDGPPLHPNCRCTEGIVG